MLKLTFEGNILCCMYLLILSMYFSWSPLTVGFAGPLVVMMTGPHNSSQPATQRHTWLEINTCVSNIYSGGKKTINPYSAEFLKID